MDSFKILLVEDDLGLALSLKDFFEDNGLNITHTADGNNAFTLFKKENPHLVLMDIILPNKTGFEIIAKIRGVDLKTPIILMTGTELDSQNEIKGYELGAINYIRKPVLPQAVLAQIKSLLSIPKDAFFYQVGKHRIILQNQTLQIDHEIIKIWEKDSLVLSILLKRQNQIVSRETILKYTWVDDSSERHNMLDGIILRLRKIIKPYQNIQIRTVYGNGYILEAR